MTIIHHTPEQRREFIKDFYKLIEAFEELHEVEVKCKELLVPIIINQFKTLDEKFFIDAILIGLSGTYGKEYKPNIQSITGYIVKHIENEQKNTTKI